MLPALGTQESRPMRAQSQRTGAETKRRLLFPKFLKSTQYSRMRKTKDAEIVNTQLIANSGTLNRTFAF